MSMKIYTKTGDKGTTSLIGGTKVSKADLRIETYGTVDELNSYVGLCRDLITDETSKNTLQEVQDRLFTIGSALAVDPAKESKLKIPDLLDSDVFFLEQQIDAMDCQLPPMKFFVLPGGNVAVSNIHVARCVCRRAERCCVRLANESGEDYSLIVKYINRLSDYLFMLSRYVAKLTGAEEIPWKPRVS